MWKLKKGKNRERGFTLIELLVVLIILGILAAVATGLYQSYIKKARTAEGNNIISALFNAEKAYYGKHGSFTSSTDDLVNEGLIDQNDLNEWDDHWTITLTGGSTLTIKLQGVSGTDFEGITMTFNYTPGTAPEEPTVTFSSG